MIENTCRTLTLTVNKKNFAAIAAYQRHGFKIIGDSIVNVGSDFVMNDYLTSMTKF